MLTFIMLTTFAVFPGVIFECRLIFIENIVADPSKITPWTFWAIVMIFNIGDTIGKLLVDTKLG